jgi:hypothetical protein
MRYIQILGHWKVQTKSEREYKGFLCLLLFRSILAGSALIIVVNIYCRAWSADIPRTEIRDSIHHGV